MWAEEPMASANSTSSAAPLRLRPYEPADLEETVGLWYRVWHHTFPDLTHPQGPEAWAARFRDELAPHKAIWVAEAGRHIVGFMAVDEGRGVLDQLFVESSYHGGGVGTALLAKAKELVPTGLTLTTLAQNMSACRFYERHNFLRGEGGVNPVNSQPSVTYSWRP